MLQQRKSSWNVARIAVLMVGLAACVSSQGDGIDDVESIESATFGVDAEGKADSLASTAAFFSTRQDVRRCIYPLCGGTWVKLANFSRTPCPTSRPGRYTLESECYVAEIRWDDELGFSEEDAAAAQAAVREGRALLRGTYGREQIGSYNVTVLHATEVWSSPTSEATSDIVYAVNDSGIRCITYPCFSLHEAKINSTISRELSGLSLEGTGASEEDLTAAYEALGERLLVAGTHSRTTGPAGRGISLTASRFWVPFEPTPAAQACGSRGLAPCGDGEFCSFSREAGCGYADAPGVCAPTPSACTRDYRPVCGCDGQTYGNECGANANGVSVYYEGECTGGER